MASVTTPSEPPPPLAELPKAAPLQLDLPAQKPDAELAPRKAAARSGPGANVRTIVTRGLLGLVVVGLAAAAATAFYLPRWIRQQFIDAAAAHGITLAIDGARIESGGFRLVGLRATAADLPGATASAPEIEVETSGLRPTRMTVRGAELTMSGPWSQVDAALAKWRASPGGGQGGDWAPTQLVIDESRIEWQKPVGDNGRIDAANVHLDVAWRTTGAEVHARSDKVTVGVPGGALGPWRVDLDRAPGTLRARVALDPGVPDACTMMIVGDDERTTHVDVVVPRSPPGRLGLSPKLFGLQGKDLQVEASIHYSDLGGDHAEVSATGGVHGIEAGGLPRALDVTWEASATGDPHKGMDIKKARLAAGPLVGLLSGTIKTFDDGFRVDLAWSAAAVPCNAFDTPLDDGQPFDIAYQLRKLAQATGITTVAGEVSARGTATLDSRDLGSTHLEFDPQASCRVSLFGQ
jgi:hypothetical protein